MCRLLGAQVELVGARGRDSRELFLKRCRHFREFFVSHKISRFVFGNPGSHKRLRNSVEVVVAGWVGKLEDGDAHSKFRDGPFARFHASGFLRRAASATCAIGLPRHVLPALHCTQPSVLAVRCSQHPHSFFQENRNEFGVEVVAAPLCLHYHSTHAASLAPFIVATNKSTMTLAYIVSQYSRISSDACHLQ